MDKTMKNGLRSLGSKVHSSNAIGEPPELLSAIRTQPSPANTPRNLNAEGERVWWWACGTL